ncbi:MAG: NAD(P)-dependent oxidoreductase, partial [Lachnospiraceae bacterium]|nr:NAD(P)-dependent oxidoreductase [Lachnospiraceae bacterium]
YGVVGQRLQKHAYDAFFHLAWDGSTGKEKVDNRNNFKLQNQNVMYALDAVELCHELECPVFVMTGSQAVYGRKSCPVTEEMDRKPENGYGMAKMCAEGMTRLLCRQYGIRHIWPILFSVYGPCDGTESLIDTTIRGLLRGDTLPYTKGEQRWDYLYSYDAAKALLLLALYGKDGETYHVANGSSNPLEEYIRIIYRMIAPDTKPRLGEVPYALNQVMYLGADITKLRVDTGFVPEYTFEEGIREIIESIRLEMEKGECV